MSATQRTFWDLHPTPSPPVVNVAQIPQRSPFRYPGGKTWLVPTLRKWLTAIPRKPKYFIEPFAGGGIISLTVAFEDLADQVFMVELDHDIAAVWKTMLSDDNDWLAEKIASFQMTIPNLRAELAKTVHNTKTLAFHTVLRNRTCHGGILAPGSGILKYGENGKGIKSRWYPATLAKRIQNIKHIRHKITFLEADGIAVIKHEAPKKSAAFFIDPPYTAGGKKAGKRLYVHHELDHENLFLACEGIRGDFLMTYDNAGALVDMAKQHSFVTDTIAMTNTHHTTMHELLIGKNLDWINALI
jgi:DNA adenine methylase